MAHRQYKEEPGVAVAGDHVSYHHHAPHTHTTRLFFCSISFCACGPVTVTSDAMHYRARVLGDWFFALALALALALA